MWILAHKKSWKIKLEEYRCCFFYSYILILNLITWIGCEYFHVYDFSNLNIADLDNTSFALLLPFFSRNLIFQFWIQTCHIPVYIFPKCNVICKNMLVHIFFSCESRYIKCGMWIVWSAFQDFYYIQLFVICIYGNAWKPFSTTFYVCISQDLD